ncbi:MAG TPA: hypothetical protein VM638_00625, partial [Actinomycetota bacterium]|nr:hypothetical protein [Actinomycetota bacterium]
MSERHEKKRRFAPLVAMLSIAMVGWMAPAGANHSIMKPGELPKWMQPDAGDGSVQEAQPRSGLREVGFHGLENKGFNTDIAPWASMNGGVYAATGTWGSFPVLGAEADGDACPSERDPSGQSRSGVWLIEATDPANPEIVAKLPTIPGAQNNDPKVQHLPTVDGGRDLLIHGLEPCGVEGVLHQIPGSPFVDVATTLQREAKLDQTGFQVYDVSDPSNPVRLGTWNNGGIGTHNLLPFTHGDRSYVAAVFNKVDYIGAEESEL